MATNQYLVITDDTTTVTIADGGGGVSNYRLLRGTWSPSVAGLRRSQLGGNGPYADVTEEMQLIISGATAEAALTNIQTLYALLEQADRWARGESVTAVKIKYSPRGATTSSAAAPLQAVILGRADGDESALRLPEIFEDVGLFLYVANVTIRFKRRGAWLHTAQTAASSATNNGEIASVSLTALSLSSPTKIQISNVGTNSSSISTYGNGYILLNADGELGILNAGSVFAGATDYTAVSGTAQYSRSGSVLRFTPTATTERLTSAVAMAWRGTRSAIFANIKINTTSGISFDVRLIADNVSTTPLSIEAVSPSVPNWYFLGILSFPDWSGAATQRSVKLGITASGTALPLDVDTIVVSMLSDVKNSNIVGFIQTSNLLGGGGSLNIDHSLLTYTTPGVFLSSSPNNVAMPYTGDASLFTNTADLSAVILQTGGSASLDSYRVVNSGSVAVNTFTATRTTGYLVPR